MSRSILDGLAQALHLAGDTHNLDDLQEQLEDGDAQWWQAPGTDSCIITELVVFPRRRVVRYWLAAGELAPVLELQPAIDDWARRQGATHAVLEGRRGWERLLPRWGWRARAIAMYKELGEPGQ